ncbi:MAG TPA: single-stranded DNA-binding protein [Candidatus Moranbacteria bacterium]|nr:single-stranded DNA-binding protein [Candidatus Moranbacteria bacterium]
MDLNKVMFIGNIVSAPELRTIPSGQTVAQFRLATNRRWKDKNTGEAKEESQFHNIVAWGKLSEIISQYVTKGQKIYVEGRLTHRSYDDQQGQKRYWTEVVADNVIMLSPRGNSQPGVNPNQAPPANNQENSNINVPAPEEIPTINIDDDKEEVRIEDIPF